MTTEAPQTPPEDGTGRRLSIEELSTMSGLPPRTIRHYIAQDLVSRASAAGRNAYYEMLHVRQLLEVKRLLALGYSLSECRTAMASFNPDTAPPPGPRPRAGSVEVWSHMILSDGLEIHVEPGRAGLNPQQVRDLVRAVVEAHARIRAEGGSGAGL